MKKSILASAVLFACSNLFAADEFSSALRHKSVHPVDNSYFSYEIVDDFLAESIVGGDGPVVNYRRLTPAAKAGLFLAIVGTISGSFTANIIQFLDKDPDGDGRGVVKLEYMIGQAEELVCKVAPDAWVALRSVLAVADANANARPLLPGATPNIFRNHEGFLWTMFQSNVLERNVLQIGCTVGFRYVFRDSYDKIKEYNVSKDKTIADQKKQLEEMTARIKALEAEVASKRNNTSHPELRRRQLLETSQDLLFYRLENFFDLKHATIRAWWKRERARRDIVQKCHGSMGGMFGDLVSLGNFCNNQVLENNSTWAAADQEFRSLRSQAIQGLALVGEAGKNKIEQLKQYYGKDSNHAKYIDSMIDVAKRAHLDSAVLLINPYHEQWNSLRHD